MQLKFKSKICNNNCGRCAYGSLVQSRANWVTDWLTGMHHIRISFTLIPRARARALKCWLSIDQIAKEVDANRIDFFSAENAIRKLYGRRAISNKIKIYCTITTFTQSECIRAGVCSFSISATRRAAVAAAAAKTQIESKTSESVATSAQLHMSNAPFALRLALVSIVHVLQLLLAVEPMCGKWEVGSYSHSQPQASISEIRPSTSLALSLRRCQVECRCSAANAIQTHTHTASHRRLYLHFAVQFMFGFVYTLVRRSK